jgi:hypothetical protein
MAQPKPFDRAHEHAGPPPVLTPEESRQGVISGRVLTILTTSLMLAAIAFAIVYALEIL